MERQCDLRGRQLVVECSPCGRRGLYALDRLRQRFGEHADLYEVYLRLTQSCRHQRAVGTRQPNQYGLTCRAAISACRARPAQVAAASHRCVPFSMNNPRALDGNSS